VVAFEFTAKAESEVWQNILIWGTTPEVENGYFQWTQMQSLSICHNLHSYNLIMNILEGLSHIHEHHTRH
jgi:hypothetical protein